MKRYYWGDGTISNYWKLRLIERGARDNLPPYSVLAVTTNVNLTPQIAEGIWLSKVARALYA
jgi:hypothetical protein